MNVDLARKIIKEAFTQAFDKTRFRTVTSAQQKPVERFVEQILSTKQRDAKADMSALEREIDLLVYALYGLTQEEIKVVEGVDL